MKTPLHPLLEGSLAKRCMRSGLTEDEEMALCERLAELCHEHDKATNRVHDLVADSMQAQRDKVRERMQLLTAEYHQLHRMVVADYETVLAPATQYVAAVRAERDAILAEMKRSFESATAESGSALSTVVKAINAELSGFYDRAFKIGKAAANDLLDEAREAARRRDAA
jgi:hypothetical protein